MEVLSIPCSESECYVLSCDITGFTKKPDKIISEHSTRESRIWELALPEADSLRFLTSEYRNSVFCPGNNLIGSGLLVCMCFNSYSLKVPVCLLLDVTYGEPSSCR